jgi:hypothetical protein
VCNGPEPTAPPNSLAEDSTSFSSMDSAEQVGLLMFKLGCLVLKCLSWTVSLLVTSVILIGKRNFVHFISLIAETVGVLVPVHKSTPVRREAMAGLVAEEGLVKEAAVSDHQDKPGRPRLHRRQQSLFLLAATRRSQVGV